MKNKKNNIYKIIFTFEVILFVGMIAMLKLIPITINSVFVFITLLFCKLIIDNLVNRIFSKNEDYVEIMPTEKINIKSKRKYYIIATILLTLILFYYLLIIINYHSLTSQNKLNKALTDECKINLIKEDNNSKYYANDNDSCHLDISFIVSNKKRNDIYTTYKKGASSDEEPIYESNEITSWDGIEWSASGRIYAVVYQKRNTIVYIKSHIKYKEEIKKIMKKIGYTSESTSQHIFN